jgi:hypothetical protein
VALSLAELRRFVVFAYSTPPILDVLPEMPPHLQSNDLGQTNLGRMHVKKELHGSSRI